jgi:nitrogen regulatory protein PII
MKKITAIIRTFKMEDDKEAFWNLGVKGTNVSEVQGFCRQKVHTEV